MHMSEDEEYSQDGEIREEFPRRDTKTPSRITQKNHLEELIIGDMNDRLHTTRQLLYKKKQHCCHISNPAQSKMHVKMRIRSNL